LNEQEIREVIGRAQLLESRSQELLQSQENDELVRAAQEAGISRDAVLQALRERFEQQTHTYDVGDLVFARSGDGHLYVAKVLGQGTTAHTVRFLNGSEAVIANADMRPLSLTPGQKVNFYTPSYGTWMDGHVEQVNMDAFTATILCWGVSTPASLEKVRIIDRPSSLPVATTATLWAVGLVSLMSGGVIGAIIQHFLRR
jgi:hypothetical protein